MKRIVCGVVLLVMAIAVSSFALEGKVSIVLNQPAQLAGQQLPQGEYKVSFTGTGNEAKVTLTSADKKTVATANAKVVEGAKANRTAVVVGDGSLKEIILRDKTQSLVF